MASQAPHTPPAELIKQVHAAGMKVGVAVKPGTEVDVLYPLLDGEGEKPDVRSHTFPLTHPFPSATPLSTCKGLA